MALEIEDGTGKSNAESYLSETDADTYHTNHGDSSDWSGATTAEKEEALRMGTQYLDLVYMTRWKGQRANDDQALAWPRYYVYDQDDIAIDSDEIPQKLKDACAEAALRHITEIDGLLPDIDEPGTIESETVGVGQGAVKESIKYMGGKSQIKKFRKIDLLLAGLIESGCRLSRG